MNTSRTTRNVPLRLNRDLLFLFLQDVAVDEQAQGLIEFALAMSVFAVVMLGIASLGRIAYATIEVTSAASAGVAYGAQNRLTAIDTVGMGAAATNDGSDISGWNTVGLSATAKQACTCSNGTAITCATGLALCTPPAHLISKVQVNTTATVDPLFYVPGLPRSYVLKGTAIMAVQQ